LPGKSHVLMLMFTSLLIGMAFFSDLYTFESALRSVRSAVGEDIHRTRQQQQQQQELRVPNGTSVTAPAATTATVLGSAAGATGTTVAAATATDDRPGGDRLDSGAVAAQQQQLDSAAASGRERTDQQGANSTRRSRSHFPSGTGGDGGGGDGQQLFDDVLSTSPVYADDFRTVRRAVSQNRPFCVPWTFVEDDDAMDRWWTHRPDWFVSDENDNRYCFSPIREPDKAELFRQLYDVQFRSDCTKKLHTKKMWSSGWVRTSRACVQFLLEIAIG